MSRLRNTCCSLSVGLSHLLQETTVNKEAQFLIHTVVDDEMNLSSRPNKTDKTFNIDDFYILVS